MTRQQRIERELPELMAELAPARIPDYFDSMLQQVARTPQRPAWRSPERWIAMGELARPAPLGLPSWRPLIVFALLALAIAAGTVLVAGSRRPTFDPAPLFGPAANGAILYGSADGDILRYDPTTGETAPLVTGETLDEGPWFSADGTRFYFMRMDDAGTGAAGLGALYVADADGGNARELIPSGRIGGWTDWSPAGDRIVISDNADRQTFQVVDATTGAVATVRVPMDVLAAYWRPGHDEVLLVAGSSQNQARRYWLANPDGTQLRELPTGPGTINEPTLSPDGRLLAYSTWETGTGTEGLLHVLDLDTNTDRVVSPPDKLTRLLPQFSPDGKSLLSERYDELGYRLSVMPLDGGPETLLGEPHPAMTDGAAATWSPDGTQVLVMYRDDGAIWLLAADGTQAERVTWQTTQWPTWQRMAP